ncbi:hypothetical protein [Saccharopolyspora hattusasensis]|uniref:hypothetical protein n=1 Tax=Saccharopolyspora hattusasensis TaxID=1128679 RepID=UPI003D9993C4
MPQYEQLGILGRIAAREQSWDGQQLPGHGQPDEPDQGRRHRGQFVRDLQHLNRLARRYMRDDCIFGRVRVPTAPGSIESSLNAVS